MHPLDIAALTAAGYSRLNVLDDALDVATKHDALVWLRASRAHLVWDTITHQLDHPSCA